MANVYSVNQVNTYIKNMFAQDIMLGLVCVRGEVSNLKYHSSGHIYFTLKDEKSAIACVMFGGNVKTGLNFRMQEGMQVIAKGSVQVYERDGKYQLYVKTLKEEGIGDLKEKYEALKQKLEEMGMFAPEYKRPIPKFVKKLGVVTAPTGAAVRDIINVALRRNPYVQIIVYPAIVQGEQAPKSIIRGIKALEEYGVDVIIAGRGGGSMEDLFCFNDEELAGAIFDCQVPVISAVGHEVDFTIADFVADKRAATPSAAAEIAVCDMTGIIKELDSYKKRLNSEIEFKISKARSIIDTTKLRLDHLHPSYVLNDKRTRLIAIEDKLNELIVRSLDVKKHALSIYIERMKGLSPLEKLGQGYSHVRTKDDKTLTDIGQVKAGEEINVYVKNGVINAKVVNTKEVSLEGVQ